MSQKVAVLGAAALLSGALSLVPSAARADESPWVVRLRGIYIDPTNDSDVVSVPGAVHVPKNGVHGGKKIATVKVNPILAGLGIAYRF